MTKLTCSFFITLAGSALALLLLLVFSNSGNASSLSSSSSSSLSDVAALFSCVLKGDPSLPMSTASSQQSAKAELGELSLPEPETCLLEPREISGDILLVNSKVLAVSSEFIFKFRSEWELFSDDEKSLCEVQITPFFNSLDVTKTKF